MAKNKKGGRRNGSTLSTRFKKNPITTTVGEMKKLGVPKIVSKLALLGIATGAVSPGLSKELNRIPAMHVFTSSGAKLRAMINKKV